MADKLHFQITTPERTVFSDTVDEVVLPTPSGEIGILPNHIPLVSMVRPGEIRIIKGGETTYLAVSGGFIQVHPDRVVVLADTAERAEEIDEVRAEQARERAQRIMKEKRSDAQDFAAVAAKIEKELVRLRVAKRRTRRRSTATIRQQQ